MTMDIPTTKTSNNISVKAEDRKMVEEQKNKINFNDVNSIVTFGADAQAPLAKLSDTMLDNVKARDTGEVGEQLTGMVTAMKSIKIDTLGMEKKQGFLSKILGKVNPIEKFNERFDSVADVVESATLNLSKYATNIMRDNIFLDKQKEAAKEAVKLININIVALEEKMQELDSNIIDAEEKYKETNDILDAQTLNEFNEIRDRLDRRRNDMLLSRQVIATLNIRNTNLKNSNINLLEKIQTQIVTGIPLWKMEITQRLMNGTRAGATNSLKESMDFTNELIRTSALESRETNKQIKEQTNRGIVDVKAIQEMTENLIGTLTDTIEITNQGRQERLETEKALIECSTKLKNALVTNVHEQANANITTSNPFVEYNKEQNV